MKRESSPVPGQAPALLILQARRDEQIVLSGKERAVRREQDRSAIGSDSCLGGNEQRALVRGEGSVLDGGGGAFDVRLRCEHDALASTRWREELALVHRRGETHREARARCDGTGGGVDILDRRLRRSGIRRQGRGGHLAAAGEDRARERGCRPLHLESPVQAASSRAAASRKRPVSATSAAVARSSAKQDSRVPAANHSTRAFCRSIQSCAARSAASRRARESWTCASASCVSSRAKITWDKSQVSTTTQA